MAEQDEKIQLRLLHQRVKDLILERHDHQAYYYRPMTAKFVRSARDTAEYVLDTIGD